MRNPPLEKGRGSAVRGRRASAVARQRLGHYVKGLIDAGLNLRKRHPDKSGDRFILPLGKPARRHRGR